MESYIRRDSYLEQLINRRENGLNKVITGTRWKFIRFLSENIMIMQAGTRQRLMRNMPCTAVCRWCCFERRRMISSGIFPRFSRRSVSRTKSVEENQQICYD